jgi:hypothetical protein
MRKIRRKDERSMRDDGTRVKKNKCRVTLSIERIRNLSEKRNIKWLREINEPLHQQERYAEGGGKR